MLEVDDSNDLTCTEDGSGQNSLEMVFRKAAKDHEARVVGGIRSNGHRFTVLRDPPRDSLPQLNTQVIDQVGVGVFRGTQYQLPLLENINEARITGDDSGYKLHN